jgi:hypothetical protein
MAEYNGWKNYETWNAALWLDNDQGAQQRWTERAEELVQEAIDNDESDPRDEAEETLAKELEADCDEQFEACVKASGMFADILNAGLREIDWRDIAEHYLADVEIFSAGWNMPGYMPDNPPALFTDAEDARSYIFDQMEDVVTNPEDEARANACRDGKGEYGETIGDYHYFVTKL